MSGTLWVTVDHSTQDRVLATGEWFAVFQRQPMLVTALEEARMEVRAIPGFRPWKTWRHWAFAILGSLAHRRRRH